MFRIGSMHQKTIGFSHVRADASKNHRFLYIFGPMHENHMFLCIFGPLYETHKCFAFSGVSPELSKQTAAGVRAFGRFRIRRLHIFGLVRHEHIGLSHAGRLRVPGRRGHRAKGPDRARVSSTFPHHSPPFPSRALHVLVDARNPLCWWSAVLPSFQKPSSEEGLTSQPPQGPKPPQDLHISTPVPVQAN